MDMLVPWRVNMRNERAGFPFFWHFGHDHNNMPFGRWVQISCAKHVLLDSHNPG